MSHLKIKHNFAVILNIKMTDITIKGNNDPKLSSEKLLELLQKSPYHKKFNVSYIHNGYVVYEYYFNTCLEKDHIYCVITSISFNDNMYHSVDRIYTLDVDEVNLDNTEFEYMGYGKISGDIYL